MQKFKCLLLLLIITVTHVSAQTPDDLKQLIESGQYPQAYDLAQTLLFEYEGQPEFDFYYGRAALENGFYDEAVFAFERVVINYPKQLRVHLELGRAYFFTKNYPGARSSFDKVLASNPPDNVRSNIQSFLDEINRQERALKSQSSAYVESFIGADSNVNSATSLNAVNFTGIGVIDLGLEGTQLDDEFLRMAAGGSYSYLLTQRDVLTLRASTTNTNNFSTDTFDLDTYSIEGSYTSIEGKQLKSIGIRHQEFVLDKDRFQHTTGIFGQWMFQLDETTRAFISGSASSLHYSQDYTRDAYQVLVAAGLSKQADALMHGLTLFYANEPAQQAVGEAQGKNFGGLGYSLNWQVNPQHAGYLRLLAQSSRYDADNVVFAVRRRDVMKNITTGWQWNLDKSLSVKAEYSYTDTQSPIPLFDYIRSKFEVGLRYQF